MFFHVASWQHQKQRRARVLRLFVCVAPGSRVLSGWRRLTVTYTRRILQSGRCCFDSRAHRASHSSLLKYPAREQSSGWMTATPWLPSRPPLLASGATEASSRLFLLHLLINTSPESQTQHDGTQPLAITSSTNTNCCEINETRLNSPPHLTHTHTHAEKTPKISLS